MSRLQNFLDDLEVIVLSMASKYFAMAGSCALAVLLSGIVLGEHHVVRIWCQHILFNETSFRFWSMNEYYS